MYYITATSIMITVSVDTIYNNRDGVHHTYDNDTTTGGSTTTYTNT